MRPLFVYAIPFHVGHHNLFLIDGSFCNDFAVWSANKTLPPELDSVAAGGCFMANAICNRDIATIRDGMTALDRFPGGMLRGAELLLFRRIPADCPRINNIIRSAQCS